MHLRYRQGWEAREVHLPLALDRRSPQTVRQWTPEMIEAQKTLDLGVKQMTTAGDEQAELSALRSHGQEGRRLCQALRVHRRATLVPSLGNEPLPEDAESLFFGGVTIEKS
jgi:hypothetical protein